MYRLVILFFCVPTLAWSQTDNDDMINAETISVEQVIHSKTNGNTVEYACIDESLTGKCIKYHNDQWYVFNSGLRQTLYINISNQNCRDLFGVQLVVIKGDLCSPDTYSILDCVSLATQDDIYVELKNVAPNTSYWLNVDGYLHDFCSFELQVSEHPRGQSAKLVEGVLENSDVTREKTVVKLDWKVSDTLSFELDHFELFRRASRAFTFTPICQIPVSYNAYGKMQVNYSATDTLYQPDNYQYRIVAVNKTKRLEVVAEHSVTVPEEVFDKVVLPLDYDRGTPLTLKIMHNGAVLDESTFSYNPIQHAYYTVFTTKYLLHGFKRLDVHVTNTRNAHSRTYLVNLENGRVYSP